jgi:hypothetical protein
MHLEPRSSRETAKFWLARIRKQLEERMTVRKLEMDGDTLLAAQCNICLQVWERPSDMDDEEADGSLGRFVHDHKDRHRAR